MTGQYILCNFIILSSRFSKPSYQLDALNKNWFYYCFFRNKNVSSALVLTYNLTKPKVNLTTKYKERFQS